MNAINETNRKSQVNGIFLFWKHTITSEWNVFCLVFYKKTGERYIEWHRMTTSDSEWYKEWQWMTTSGTTSDNNWQGVTLSDKKWYNCKNDTVYFKEWMIAIFSITKLDTLL